MTTEPTDITGFLKAWGRGDTAALEQLTPIIYEQLRRLAGGYVHKERAGHSLQATALVHEAYLRLVKTPDMAWQDRDHFFAVAARIMRHILVDYARRGASAKRGGQGQRADHSTAVDLDQLTAADTERARELCELDEALKTLGQIDPRRAQVVELRFFGGFSVEETADILGVSPVTVMRDWKVARAWLTRELRR